MLGLPEGVVLMDAGYGNDAKLRTETTALGMRYVAGIGRNTSVWAPGTGPLPAPPGKGLGRPPKLVQRDEQHQPTAVKTLALSLLAQAWQPITWREGSADWLSSRFARQRVRPAHRDTNLSQPRRRMAADRVAGRRSRAGQVLACHFGGGHQLRGFG